MSILFNLAMPRYDEDLSCFTMASEARRLGSCWPRVNVTKQIPMNGTGVPNDLVAP